MNEYIYNAKRGWVNIQEAYLPFVKTTKQEDINSPDVSYKNEFKYGDKHNVPPTSRVNKDGGYQMPEFLPSDVASNVIFSLSDSFKNLRENINKKRMSRDLVHLMRISAEINKLIKYINPSYRSKSFSTIPSGLKTVLGATAELGLLLQDKIKENKFSTQYKRYIDVLNAQMNTYVRETSRLRD